MDKEREHSCAIHYEAIKSDKLVTPQNYASWLTLFEAAKIRSFQPILNLAKTVNEGEIPSIAYHRDCRSRLTFKRDLDSLEQKEEGKIEGEEDDETGLSRAKSESCQIVLAYTNRNVSSVKKTNMLDPNSREKLVKVVQIRVDETQRNIATEKCDHKIMALTSREIVAAEAHYHRSCYRVYTRPKQLGLRCDISDDTQDAEFDVFSDLFEHIRAEVEKQRVIPMTEVEELKRCERRCKSTLKEKLLQNSAQRWRSFPAVEEN